jgi:16S rRNA (cytosine1402-N4)-methyltransferase
MEDSFRHQTVLLNEAVNALNLKEDGCYVDATYGRGGHSQKILHGLGSQGRLIVIDKDPQAVAHAQEVHANDNRMFVWQGSFKDFPDALAEAGVEGGVDGLLLDLGVSSPQLDDASRGFSFMRDGDLDMRMNPGLGESASQWLNRAKEEDIVKVLWQFGEEKFSRRIARVLVEEREQNPITTTLQLANLIATAVPESIRTGRKGKRGRKGVGKQKSKHPATRSFQAIRIYINRELEDLQTCLDRSVDHLAKNGRLVVISFHSLEDRIVKRFLQKESQGPKIPRGIPVMADHYTPKMKKVGKAIKSGKEEVENNPRARSAIMRIGEKTQ